MSDQLQDRKLTMIAACTKTFRRVCRIRRHRGALILGLVLCFLQPCSAESNADESHATRKSEAEQVFRKDIKRFIKSYCIDCHQNSRPTEAGVNFDPALKAPAHAAFSTQWKKAAARVKAHDMPPEDLEQPTDDERRVFLDWVNSIKYLSPRDPGEFVIRRLTKTEYGNTLRDLFGVDPQIAASLPDEVSGEGYLNSLSPLQLEQYLSIAEKVLSQVWPASDNRPIDLLEQLSGSRLRRDGLEPSEVKGFATALAKRMYRRPATKDEVATLMDVYQLGKESNLDPSAALRLMVKATLVSPQFLFITPSETLEAKGEIVRLDDHQLASRMSYFLWATMPDDALMTLADAGKLHEPAVLEAQVRRMLSLPRSRALFDGFGAQWLGLDDWTDRTFDFEKFPDMTNELRTAMFEEARLFFENVVRENRSVESLIDSDFTYMNQTLARIYDLGVEIAGPTMRKITLTDRNRGGILGMPAVLAATSFPNRTSPVNRGVWVLEQILGENVPSAPPDVPALEELDGPSANDLTLREQTEMHRANPVCANCHRLLDPIGFGLENFDAIGRWRTEDDHGHPIDAAGELPDGRTFSGPAELKAMVKSRLDEFSRNLAERMLAYALCRKLEGYDEIVVDEMMQAIEKNDYCMQSLITEIVTSYPFTHRRVQDER